MNYPRIYLVLDNCFAIKRWIKPSEWMQIAHDLGFRYVQASTDNEMDPLFSTDSYMDNWFEEVKDLQNKTGVQVVNFYTGYQTYRTVGLAHYDSSIRTKIRNEWIKKLILRIANLHAKGLGFSFFAIDHETLQRPDKYRETTEMLFEQLAEITEFAYQNGDVQISFEQMYSPHQPPFTIRRTREYIQNIYAINKRPVYVTVDVGHMTGQRRFLMPDREKVAEAVRSNSFIWLGSDQAYKKYEKAVCCIDQDQNNKLLDDIIADINEHKYLFSSHEDTDVYRWLGELACYSPIIHMQQTDGITSNHASFTPETNRGGIIKGNALLAAIKESYDQAAAKLIQEPVKDIYLSFELFFSNVETKKEIITKLKQTIEYWRKFIPEDGLPLKELL